MERCLNTSIEMLFYNLLLSYDLMLNRALFLKKMEVVNIGLVNIISYRSEKKNMIYSTILTVSTRPIWHPLRTADRHQNKCSKSILIGMMLPREN
jgi:hypothetical protein